jgi:YHS domain-containing protein
MPIDPVCGMTVDEGTAAATSEYKGVAYYFCAPGCKTAFDKDPEKYLHDEAKAKARRGWVQRLNPFARRKT